MSVPEQTPINQFIIAGGETSGPWTWNLQKESELVVTKQLASTGTVVTLVLNADYTVNPAGLDNDGGGTINFLAPQLPAVVGDVWTLSRNTASDRSPDFATRGAFFAKTINAQLDELTRITQDQKRDIGTAVRKDPGVGDILNPLIPQPVDERALKFRDSGGGNFEMVMSDSDPDQQANDAAVSAAAALASEQAAGLSETNAGNSETAAGISETNAGNSETNAASSESNAANSETNAGLSETAAGLSETAAGLSETNADNSETAAGLSETAAGLSETAAGLSETAAGLSETNADNSETAAGISETNASTSETNAATSETNAAISAASGYLKNIISVSANTTLTIANQGNEVRVDTTSGDINITLPDSTTLSEDFRVAIIKISADANVVNVNRSGSDTINGGTTILQGEQFVRRTYALDQSAGIWVIDATTPVAGGKVLQVLQGSKTDTQSSSPGPAIFTAVVGLSVSITPQNTANKVLISGFVNAVAEAITGFCAIRLLRNGTVIGNGAAAGVRISCMACTTVAPTEDVGGLSTPITFLDSPASVSPLSYTVEVAPIGVVGFLINRSNNDANFNSTARGACHLIATEIGA